LRQEQLASGLLEGAFLRRCAGGKAVGQFGHARLGDAQVRVNPLIGSLSQTRQ
jgi:hypothetical protein